MAEFSKQYCDLHDEFIPDFDIVEIADGLQPEQLSVKDLALRQSQKMQMVIFSWLYRLVPRQMMMELKLLGKNMKK